MFSYYSPLSEGLVAFLCVSVAETIIQIKINCQAEGWHIQTPKRKRVHLAHEHSKNIDESGRLVFY